MSVATLDGWTSISFFFRSQYDKCILLSLCGQTSVLKCEASKKSTIKKIRKWKMLVYSWLVQHHLRCRSLANDRWAFAIENSASYENKHLTLCPRISTCHLQNEEQRWRRNIWIDACQHTGNVCMCVQHYGKYCTWTVSILLLLFFALLLFFCTLTHSTSRCANKTKRNE